jgi:adenylosuccinate synthase
VALVHVVLCGAMWCYVVFCREPLETQGVDWKGRLFISDRAHVLFPFHRTVDGLRDDSLSVTGDAIGTTKKV